MSLRLAHVSSEFSGLAQTGGLADAVAALTKELGRCGQDLKVFLPLYGLVASGDLDLRPEPELQEIVVPFSSAEYTFSVSSTEREAGPVRIYFIDCPAAYGRSAIYDDAGDEHLRFALLARAAIEICQRLAWTPRVFHCHDWHAALLPLYLRTIYAWDERIAETRTALTIHNLAYQGAFAADLAGDLGIPRPERLLHRAGEGEGSLNFLATGIRYADWVTTVSPTYAREILDPEHGAGLESLLRSRVDRLEGVLNGVDYEIWSPETDELIPARYSMDDMSGKAECRAALLREAGLGPDPSGPVIGIVSRLAEQKGLDLVAAVMPRFLSREDVRLVVLGTGEGHLESMFRDLERRHPDQVAFVAVFDEALAHRIEAGSDLFLMPSRFEPCGLNQMYSLRYGTPPIVHRVGGLADTVEGFDAESGDGTGFVFDSFGPEELAGSLEAALEVYRRPDEWRRLVANGMNKDFSWSRQAAKYLAIYQRLLKAPPATVPDPEGDS